MSAETNHNADGYAIGWDDDDFAKYTIEINNENNIQYGSGAIIGVAVVYNGGKLSDGDIFYNTLNTIDAETTASDSAILPKALAKQDGMELVILPKYEVQ